MEEFERVAIVSDGDGHALHYVRAIIRGIRVIRT